MPRFFFTAAVVLAAVFPVSAAAKPLPSWLNTVHASPGTGHAIEVTPEQAAAAAQVPGAQTEGSPYSEQALSKPTYVCPDGDCTSGGDWGTDAYDSEGDPGGGYEDYSAKTCWFWTLSVEWGVYPYQGRISNDTYWCGMYGSYVTYRSSHVRLGKTLCTAGGAANYRIGGGISQWYVQTRSTGTFSCGLPYIGGVQFDHWMDTVWRADGAAYYTGYS